MDPINTPMYLYYIFYPISEPHVARSNTCNGSNQYFNVYILPYFWTTYSNVKHL